MLMSLPSLGQTSQQINSDPEVLTTEEELTGHPEIHGDSSEQSGKALHALNSVMCDFNVNSLDIPQVPVSAVSDCKVDIPKALENTTEDTVAPPSSQLKDNETTIMDINACCNDIGIQQSDDGLEEDYSEPLPLVLQHQLSEDQQRDGASDNETESDSEVPEVPVPADEAPGVLNKVLSGLSSQWRNWWERSSGKILTLTVISFFCFFFIAIYLGPMTLMMSELCVQIKFFEQIITTGHRVYYSYHMPWFRTLSLYFLLCVNNFFYGETIADYFFTLVQMEEYIHMFSKYQQFISFVSYLIGLCMFVLSLVRKHYRLQFCMFAWTHVTLLIVAMHSRSIIQDLFDGTIWVIMPISICNDIMAWMFGFIISWTFLI
ncbi:Phosphatidate cytidylyltransferase 2 [Anabarilius grahami]|uniref:phosphatidate cytidylyltransferase n=1 Tax=Anabarilius grahami TaxID=495550 RepID=A0A3N0XZ54_ANAGA|nr:Phosphatidate cytidylyltransferase 2 [Anabarilius grahami]